MLKRRGMTLVEMTLVLTLTVMVVGVCASLYGFTVSRLGHATAAYASTMDATIAANHLETTIRSASSCTQYSSGGYKALVCTMPSTGTDADGDGFAESYPVTKVTRRGIEKMGKGSKIWFYLAGETGSFGTSGAYLWRARRNDSLPPTGSDVQATFTKSTTTQFRYPLVTSFSFEIDDTARLVEFAVKASALSRDQRVTSESSDQSYGHTEFRKAFWRNSTQ